MDCLFGAVWEFSCFIAYEFTVSCVRRGTCIFEKLHFFYLCARPWWSFDGEDLMLALFRFHFFKCFFILALKNCLTQLYLNFSPSSYIYCKHLHFCFLSWSISSSNVQSAPVTLENSCVSHQHKMYTSLYNSLSLSLHSWCSNAKVVINKIIVYSCGIFVWFPEDHLSVKQCGCLGTTSGALFLGQAYLVLPLFISNWSIHRYIKKQGESQSEMKRLSLCVCTQCVIHLQLALAVRETLQSWKLTLLLGSI